MLKFMAVFAGVCLLACGLVRASLAQSVDVHLTPRAAQRSQVDATSDVSGISDSALRTHTKPLRKNVDLVLVPVTVTDPMNRLVAGSREGQLCPAGKRPVAADPVFFNRRCTDFIGGDIRRQRIDGGQD